MYLAEDIAVHFNDSYESESLQIDQCVLGEHTSLISSPKNATIVFIGKLCMQIVNT